MNPSNTPEISLLSTFLDQVRARPEAEALIETRHGRDHPLDFAELAARADAVAAFLREQGIGAGDRVLVLQGVSAELYQLLIALFWLGAAAVFPDPSAPLAQTSLALRTLQPKAVVGPTSVLLLALLLPGVRKIPHRVCLGTALPGMRRLQPLTKAKLNQPPKVSTEAEALITFTSGSTGRPKIVARSQAFLIAQYQVLKQTLTLAAGQRDLSTLPVFVLANLASGVTSILPDTNLRKPALVDVKRLATQAQRLHPDRCAAAPAFFQRLLSQRAGRNLIESLQWIGTGGGPVWPALLDNLQAVAPRATVVAIYGSSEAEPIAEYSASQTRAEIPPGAGLPLGRPVAAISCVVLADSWGQPLSRLTPDEFGRLKCPRGIIGEIMVSGPHVLTGYLKGEGDEHRKIHVDGTVWHRTGDAGYFDADGQLWLVGRASARAKVGDHWVYPLTVETLLATKLPQLRCAFLSVDQRPVLALAASPHLDLINISHVLAEANLAEIELVRVSKLPVDHRHNSKVDYPTLAKQIRKRHPKRPSTTP